MKPNDVHVPAVSRRGVMAGAGAGVAVLAVAGCADDSTGASGSGGDSGSGNGGDAADGSTKTGGALTEVADVPVGGAVSAKDAKGAPVIVSRPSENEVVAFSAVCTHKGCTVAPKADRIECPCHGSTYDLATGDNTGGPAPKPLAKVRVKVEDGKVVEG
jgi:cytochrome b6-f complex iron-sulfur subunit